MKWFHLLSLGEISKRNNSPIKSVQIGVCHNEKQIYYLKLTDMKLKCVV